ncbi:MAG TPA: hypothetical protein VM864_16160 [Pyrinomonadaceae bacterium]|jgi:hypothetical protein|nr:hypothetical protein [Pyrinomonadaceae bacterium]
MQNVPPHPTGNVGTPQPAKKGISKGCIAGIIVVVLLVVAFVVLVAAGGAGYYWLRGQAANANASPAGSPRSASRARAGGAAATEAAEAPQPTEAQSAAVAGGQSARWEQQEISWTVPQRWTKNDVGSQTFLWRSPGTWDAASLIANVSPMSADFPAEMALDAAYQQAQTRKGNGEVDEVRWLALDGVRGVMFRESAPEDEDSPQRLQWMGYRDYKGQNQLVSVMLASRGKDFARHEDALYGILYSTELTK